MKYFKNHSLLPYNTFHINVTADHFFRFDAVVELQNWLADHTPDKNTLVMGGGSNLLFISNFKGTIIYPAFKGIELVSEAGDDVLVRFWAGEEWDQCVNWAVEHGLGGIENLSWIPGHAGAAPVQNIGAYGAELADIVEYVDGIFLDNGQIFRKTREECAFDYRYSVFKGPLRNNTVVTSVVVRLTRKPHFSLNYGSVRQLVEQKGGISLANIRSAIIEIRRDKLPDTEQTGNAGSFFKNPVIAAERYIELQKEWPQIPGYTYSEKALVKVPAGWLIEQAGWKGKQMGPAGVHENQALVIINMGGATGKDICELAKTIKEDVLKKFGISLQPEVNML
jgi:UDP-N-acetylmuramate dehydrogenase